MINDFDRLIDRRHSDSVKWHYYGDDVLPMWVADMDFLSPEPAIRALRERVEHGVFGYGTDLPELRQVLVDRLADLYGWRVLPRDLVFLPGVITGFNLACRAVTAPGDGMLVQTPIYPPILRVPGNVGLTCDEMELTRQPDGHYTIDFDAFDKTMTDRTRVFILSNPHNPVGRAFQRQELERMAEICLRRNVVICSDEIHCDLLFRGVQHLPIASLDAEIANHTITLIAPSKTFNIAGLQCSVAIIQNADLRKKFKAARVDLVNEVNILGLVAALAAYREGQEWLDELLVYLEANRDLLVQYVSEQMPGIRMGKPEATYLAWLDCRQAGIPGNPHKFFLEQAKVAVNDGVTFGRGGEGFVRLNFGCPRSTLLEALDKIRAALAPLKPAP
jgi:cystathionine beta-lyase